MKDVRQLLLTFDDSSSQFWKAWNKVSGKASAKAVHSLRTSARRAAATLQLIDAVADSKHIPALERRFERVLKLTSPLRDIQVEMETRFRVETPSIGDFKRTLERRDRRERKRVQKKLSGSAKTRVGELIEDVRSDLRDLAETADEKTFHASIESILSSHRSEFFKLRVGIRPDDDETLHKMRIALKKWRYASEAALPLLDSVSNPGPDEMRDLQRQLGDVRDLRIVARQLKKWSRKEGRKKEVASTLKQLERRRQNLLKKTLQQLSSSESFSSPVTERTAMAGDRKAKPSPAAAANS